MKGRKYAAAIAAALSMMTVLSGCSVSGSVNSVMGKVTSTSKETVVSASSQEGEAVTIKKFDDSLEAPSFSTDLSGSTDVVQNGTVTLQDTATVSDGGTVTYQWYSNTVSSNGGGTIIDGAVNDTYTPPTTDGGTIYYYVVAINNHGDTINESVSPVHGVTVWANMYWQQNADNGGYQYLNHDDGTYPVSTTMEIDGVSYTFNENGFAVDPSTGDLIDITTGQAAVPAAQTAETEETASSSVAADSAAEPSETIVDADGDGIPDDQ